jgi:uncharacterized protein (TIRG00374 family)
MTARRAHRFRASRALIGVGKLVAVVLIVEFLLLPQLAGSNKSWQLLADIDNVWLIPALVLEAASLLVYALLTWLLIPAEYRPRYGRTLRIDLSTLAASHVLPAGSAVGLGLGYRLLTQAGVPGRAAATAKATQAVGSAAVLNGVLVAALIGSIASSGFTSVYGLAVGAGLALIVIAGAAAILLVRNDEGIAAWIARLLGHIPRVSEQTVHTAVLGAASYLDELGGDRGLMAKAATVALLNWLLDAAALWMCVRAFGPSVSVTGLMVSYGVANVLAAIPLLPGGLGVVEAFLIPSLVGFGVPRAEAILGVLAWRVVNFVLPIPVGLGAYLSLPGRRDGPAADRPAE